MYISLRDRTYVNNSNILITDIGEGDSSALLCHTNLKNCCRSEQTNNNYYTGLGEWLHPNSSTVNIRALNEAFYRNRDRSVVRLHRRGDSTSPTGKFCCEIPDANYTIIKMCVNLGELDCIKFRCMSPHHILLCPLYKHAVTDPSITSLAMVASGLKCRQPSTTTTTSTIQTTSHASEGYSYTIAL